MTDFGSYEGIEKYVLRRSPTVEIDDMRPESYTNEQLRQLWADFGNVPVNEDEAIEQDFLHFEVGTNRYEIWHWFDDRYPGGVVILGSQL